VSGGAARLPRVAFGAVVAALVAVVWLTGLAHADTGVVVVIVSFVLATATTGIVLVSRVPGHPVGWLLLGSAVAYALGSVVSSYIEASATVSGGLPLSPLVVWAGNISYGIGAGICATWLLLVFPDGQLPSSRWRPVAWLAGIALTALLVGGSLGPDPFEDTPVSNPVTLDPDSPVLLVLEGGGFYLFAACILASVASLVVRFRRARGVERQQLKWVASSAAVVGIVLAGTSVLEIANGPAELSDDVENGAITLALALLPVSIGVAILRYRLYEIDRLISRTVSYALLTALLLGMYAAVAVLPTLVFQVRSDLLVAAATLLAAAAFGPLRRRVQRAVDRRFNRSRYDAERVARRFAGRLRDDVDLDALIDDMRLAVTSTVQPAHLSVWVRPTWGGVEDEAPGRSGVGSVVRRGQRAAKMART